MDRIGNIEIERPKAHDLVLDLMIADGKPLSAENLCRAGGLFGIGGTAVRVALTRLVASRKIMRLGRGLYTIDPSGPALSRAIDDWQQRHVRTTTWNADWLAVHDSTVMRSHKTAWRRHSLALALRGFAALRPTLHIRPDNLAGGLQAERAQLAALGVAASALVFRLADLDPLEQSRAAALWDVRRLTAEHRALRSALGKSQRMLRRRPMDAALCESLMLGRTVIGYLLREPVLPAEMMSPVSRIQLVEATKAYQDEALGLWRQWLGRA
jgi:phenylacetic acid degradation operon negative regulatory protein